MSSAVQCPWHPPRGREFHVRSDILHIQSLDHFLVSVVECSLYFAEHSPCRSRRSPALLSWSQIICHCHSYVLLLFSHLQILSRHPVHVSWVPGSHVHNFATVCHLDVKPVYSFRSLQTNLVCCCCSHQPLSMLKDIARTFPVTFFSLSTNSLRTATKCL